MNPFWIIPICAIVAALFGFAIRTRDEEPAIQMMPDYEADTLIENELAHAVLFRAHKEMQMAGTGSCGGWLSTLLRMENVTRTQALAAIRVTEDAALKWADTSTQTGRDRLAKITRILATAKAELMEAGE